MQEVKRARYACNNAFGFIPPEAQTLHAGFSHRGKCADCARYDTTVRSQPKPKCVRANKVVFLDEDSAIGNMIGLIRKGDTGLHTYKCEFGDHWHVGHYAKYLSIL